MLIIRFTACIQFVILRPNNDIAESFYQEVIHENIYGY